MTRILDRFDINSDIWELYPEMRILLKEAYEDGVESRVIWALLLDIHPKSLFFQVEKNMRREIIEKDYLDSEDFNWEDYSAVTTKLRNAVLTIPERLLSNWKKKLEERDEFLSENPYNKENFDMLEKAMKETFKMWETYEAVEDKFLKEQESKSLGNVRESLNEQGLLGLGN